MNRWKSKGPGQATSECKLETQRLSVRWPCQLLVPGKMGVELESSGEEGAAVVVEPGPGGQGQGQGLSLRKPETRLPKGKRRAGTRGFKSSDPVALELPSSQDPQAEFGFSAFRAPQSRLAFRSFKAYTRLADLAACGFAFSSLQSFCFEDLPCTCAQAASLQLRNS